jgi:caffeoyl-CoA O-methyltransferase
MPFKSFIDPKLQSYVDQVGYHELPVLARLRTETAAMPNSRMQISPDQGHLLQILVKATGAQRTIEIGVFTGYSSTAVALALPADGHITALDVNHEYTAVARRYWDEAGIARKIDLRIAPAVLSLDALIDEGRSGSYDFAFIDADKRSYLVYFERCLTLLRHGGLIAIDNTLREGDVADPTTTDPDSIAIREFNAALHEDDRVIAGLLPIADGFTLVVKK